MAVIVTRFQTHSVDACVRSGKERGLRETLTKTHNIEFIVSGKLIFECRMMNKTDSLQKTLAESSKSSSQHPLHNVLFICQFPSRI